MSTLKADTIQSTSGGAATLTKQNAAKVRGQHASGTLQLGSLNHSSITDNGTGTFTHSFTNSFANILYSHVGSVTYNNGTSTAIWTYMRVDGAAGDTATGSINMDSAYVHATANRTDFDAAFTDLICFGDLA